MNILFAVLVLAGADPQPMSLRSWLLSAHRDLAAAAKENPFSVADAQATLLPNFVPDRPITYRARIKALAWKDGIIRADITDPLDWVRDRSLTGRRVSYTPRFFFQATEAEALKLRRGQIIVCTATISLVTDYSKYSRTPAYKMSYVLLRIQLSPRHEGYYISSDITLSVNGVKYAPVYDRSY